MAVKGVIVAAGYGSRFLPITRCVPKEMLPILDRPAVDFILDEMAAAGIEDVLVITSRRKRALEDWFDRDPELEAAFRADGATDKLARIRPPPLRATFVRQQQMTGTGDALLLARSFAGDDPIVVAYPDDIFGEPNLSAELIDAWRTTSCSALAAVDCAGEDLGRYGVLDVEDRGGVLSVRRIVEKPAPGTAPSTLVSMGRYLYTPEIFDALTEGRAEHRGPGEYYHVDAVNILAGRGRVVAVQASAPRYDTGEPLGFLQTVVEHALAHPDMGSAFEAWLRARLDAARPR